MNLSLNGITFASQIRNILTFYRSLHVVDFNMTTNNPKLSKLIEDSEHRNLISEPTHFKDINLALIIFSLAKKFVLLKL